MLFEYHLQIRMPETWVTEQRAGEEWLKQFRSHHPSLSLKKPEACSLSRATSFNKTNVKQFFDNLSEVFQKVPALGNGMRTYNLDETGLSTVQTPQKVLADSATRHLNKVTSADRGVLITACCIIAASGTHLPPVMIFPRKNFKDHMLKGAPPGTLGLAAPSGWMCGELFREVIKHFIKYTNSSIKNPSLLIFDNHESHFDPLAMKMAKKHGVHVVTIPPHCSDKMQPLDVAVYGSTKSAYNGAVDAWLTNHPGKTVSIYDVAELFNIAFQRSMTPSNIQSGFRTPGIFPFNREVFAEELFLCSFVTDRPEPAPNNEIASSIQSQLEPEEASLPIHSPPEQEETVSPTHTTLSSSLVDAQPSTSGISAFTCLGLPKAGERKGKGRKKGKSVIAISTPEMEAREKAADEKANKEEEKKKRSEERARKRLFAPVKQPGGPKRKRGPKKERTLPKKIPKLKQDREESDATDTSLSDDDFCLLSEEMALRVSDFCLVKFVTEYDHQEKYYVGEIIQLHSNAYEISFLRKQTFSDDTVSFVFRKPDITTVARNQVIQQLVPMKRTGTSRQNRAITFKLVNFPNLY